jgi:hypothetical protein
MEKRLIWCIYGNAIPLAAVAFYFFLFLTQTLPTRGKILSGLIDYEALKTNG